MFSIEWRQRLAQLIGIPGPDFDNPEAYINTIQEILAREPLVPKKIDPVLGVAVNGIGIEPGDSEWRYDESEGCCGNEEEAE